jgi:hypothetical protein
MIKQQSIGQSHILKDEASKSKDILQGVSSMPRNKQQDPQIPTAVGNVHPDRVHQVNEDTSNKSTKHYYIILKEAEEFLTIKEQQKKEV